MSHLPRFSMTRIMNGCWILSKALSAFNDMLVWLEFLSLFMCGLYLLIYICGPSFHALDKANWIKVDKLLMCSSILIVSILLRNFASTFTRKTDNFLLLLSLCMVLVLEKYWQHRKNLGVFFLFCFMENVENYCFFFEGW